MTTCPQCSGSGQIPTGADLRKIRQDAGKTLAQMGMSLPYLSRVEAGKQPVSPRVRELYERVGNGELTEQEVSDA